MTMWRCLLLLALLPPAALPDSCERSTEMPPGLRYEHYRSPTPGCVPGAKTLDTAALKRLIASEKPVLIDVWAILRRVEAGFPSAWLSNEPHHSLPGSVWLPNVGYGNVDADLEPWFIQHLQQLSGGELQRPLVFFCVADCWMSWNAVLRARSYGYHQVYWYKDGVDGWQEHGGTLQPVLPMAPP